MALEELIEAYNRERLIVAAGSGLSESAGIVSRSQLIDILLAHARAGGSSSVSEERWYAEIADLAACGQWSEALGELRDCLGWNEFCHLLEKYLDDNGGTLPDVATAIAALAPRLRAVLTTVLDQTLDRAFGGDWVSFAGVTGDIPQRDRYILKLRGMLSDRSSWILTSDECRRAARDTQRQDILNSLFHAYTILFVGYDFSDEIIENVLDRVRSNSPEQPPRHYALLDRSQLHHGALRPGRLAQLREAGIRIIDTANAGVDGQDAASFLRTLAARSQIQLVPDHGLEDLGETGPRSTNSCWPGDRPGRRNRQQAGQSCPFPGLEFFDEDQSEWFFGRDAEVSAALQLLGDTKAGHRRWLYIDGPSGAGKSSLVRAGLVPKVRAGHIAGTYRQWLVAVFRSGANPVLNLAHALQEALSRETPHRADSGPDLDTLVGALYSSETALASWIRQHTPPGYGFFLVIDQLEEAFTLADPQAARCLDTLLGCALNDKEGRLYLATTIRGDFASQLCELPMLETALNRDASRYYLKAMSEPGLRAAITQPARNAGLVWDEHLVERIMNDALDSEGSLPLVAHALQALWLKREDNRLTLAAYEGLGGVAGALTGSADAILASLSPPDRKRARELLLCLASIGPRGAYTRQPVSRDTALQAAGGGKASARVLARLSGARDPNVPSDLRHDLQAGAAISPVRLIVVTQHEHDDRVDLVHEALLRQWETLRGWLDESRKEVILHDDLRARLQAWKNAGSPPRDLPTGGELAYLLGARRVSVEERAFLVAAQTRRRMRMWRLRALFVVLLLAVICVSWLALYAFGKRNDAIASARRAESETARAQQAEQQVKAQLEEIRTKEQEAQQQKRRADDSADEARASSVKLAQTNATLTQANGKLEQALTREQEATMRARILADSERLARQDADEFARAERAAREQAQTLATRLEEEKNRAEELYEKERTRAESLLRRVGELEAVVLDR